ncbi:MAG TPA: hypothetical protein VFV19_10420 [Candidatus Polarisedimenticolaceae bacterium]|nr:hypothetical protein [Candidatus Polarisedimenticolaceae bacterium]
MAFPSPITNVPRARVGGVVQDMLDSDDSVSLVEAHEDDNGTFTVVPHRTSANVSSSVDFKRFKKSDFPDA